MSRHHFQSTRTKKNPLHSPGSVVKTKRIPASCSSTIEIITFGFRGEGGEREVVEQKAGKFKTEQKKYREDKHRRSLSIKNFLNY